MWMCRAVLPDGKVCETTNFDDANQCKVCGAPRQANEATFETHDELESFMDSAKHAAELGREKMKQYAPVAAAVAQQAREKAGTFAMHGRIATHTGIHMAGVLSFCLGLLIASIILPVALGWPMTLTVTQRSDINENQSGLQNGQEFMGSLSEARHNYEGSERVISLIPKQLTDSRKNQVQMAVLMAGPILISGTPVVLNGTGTVASGGVGKATVSLELTNSRIFWVSAIVLLVLFLIADLVIGDIYAMQKLLFSLELVWISYTLIISWFAQNYMKGLIIQLFPDVQMQLTLSGLMTGPIKIGFIGLIYWMSSMILRSLHEERTAIRAEKRRLAEATDA